MPIHLNILGVHSIVLGIVIALFFRCTSAFLNPANRMEGRVKWGLVTHVALMFSIVTVTTGMGLNLTPTAYITNREYPGDDEFPPGPIGYKFHIYATALSVTPNNLFQVNQWLADGLLVSCVPIVSKGI
jgi:hypothetical protein